MANLGYCQRLVPLGYSGLGRGLTSSCICYLSLANAFLSVLGAASGVWWTPFDMLEDFYEVELMTMKLRMGVV